MVNNMLSIKSDKNEISPGEEIGILYEGVDSRYFTRVEANLEIIPECNASTVGYIFYPTAGILIRINNIDSDEIIFRARFKYKTIFGEEGEEISELKLPIIKR